jgi:alpha-beta hydrolase superfamily lysophospholipase
MLSALCIVQNPTLPSKTTSGDEVYRGRPRRPVVLVGHSYGGAVVTEAGTHDSLPARVCMAGFAPDKGESVNTR